MTPPARVLTEGEVETLLAWAAEEGWNPGPHDARLFRAADPEGFLGALDEAGEVAAAVSVVRHGPAFAFLGLYICRPERRGRGFGMAAWRAGLAHAGGRVVGLDGVPAQQANYARSGFRLAWNNARFTGTGGGTRPAGLTDLAELPFDALAAFDAAVFEGERPAFLRAWTGQPGAVGLALLRDGRLAGWGLMRRALTGRKIGPLYATDEAAGAALLDGLLAAAPGEEVALDLPLPNAAAVREATARGMVPGFETARMYAGGTPRAPELDRIWGVTCFELG